MFGGVLEQSAHRIGFFGIHPCQQRLRLYGIQHAQQVGGVVGIHRLQDVGSALGVHREQQLGLLVLGQLLQDVGESLVVECVDHFGSALGGQFPDRVGNFHGTLALELMQQLGHTLPGHRQRRRRQALHVLPVHDVDRSAAQTSMAAYREAGDQPVARAGLLDCQIDHDEVHARQLGKLRILHPYPGVQYLAQHQHLAGALRESPQRHIGRGECHGVWLEGGQPQDGNKNPSAGEQFDNHAQDTRLLPNDAEADHDVAHATKGLAVGAQDHQPREPGHVHPVDRRHNPKGRSGSVNDAYRPRRTCLSVPGSSLKMIDKAKGLCADEVFLDLEDAVAPEAKSAARATVAAALAEPGWGGQLRGVRVNAWSTPWTHRT